MFVAKWTLNSSKCGENIVFTGIVSCISTISNVKNEENYKEFSISLENPLLKELEIGASVAVDGVCMTVTKINKTNVYFDAMKETLELTTIGTIKNGVNVNIERSLKYGGELGGHIVSGHVHGKSKIKRIDTSKKNNHVIYFSIPETLKKYIFSKGFIALNGTSLTIVSVDKSTNIFNVSFIPETLKSTTFGEKKEGDDINIEIDSNTQSIVDTVEQYLNENHKGK